MTQGIHPHYGTWQIDAAAKQKEKGIVGFAQSTLGALKRLGGPKASYLIVSWNIATVRDYSNLRSIHHKMQENLGLLGALQRVLEEPVYQATEEELTKRGSYFRKAFHNFEDPDILCLQESAEMGNGDLQAILPPGYSFCSYENGDGKECTLAWNAEKFSKIGHADLLYDAEYISSLNASPDTIVLLRDTQGMTICVASAHLRGFSLAYETLDEAGKQHAMKAAVAGDHQTQYDLETMEKAPQVDLYIFAGDFNVTTEHYPPRFEILHRFGYITDDTDKSPTIYDANLKEEDGITPQKVRLDYIFAKGSEQLQFNIQHVDLHRTGLEDFKRPSDHLPVAARLQVTNLKRSKN